MSNLLAFVSSVHLNLLSPSSLQRLFHAVFKDDNPLHWFSILVTILCIVCLSSIGYYYSATIIFVILILTLFIVIREHNLKEDEIFTKMGHVLGELKRQIISISFFYVNPFAFQTTST